MSFIDSNENEKNPFGGRLQEQSAERKQFHCWNMPE